MNLYFLLISVAVLSLFYFMLKANKARQLKYIEHYQFHKGIRHKFSQKHPQLTEQQLDKVFQELRDYFRICHGAKSRRVSMPSQVVDDAWHEFILFTRIYQKFCSKALGRFLHHLPAEAMRTLAQDGIKRSWRLACALEQINPKKPVRLPLIFAIDGLLKIDNGFIYQLDCKRTTAGAYCASHIGCSSDSSSDTSDSGCSGDSSGCSGGCSGD